MVDVYDQQTDSDEDCEVYFLKPVNEYNIVDKIKEANKELFADTANLGQRNTSNAPESESIVNVTTKTTTTSNMTTKITTMRKVTFAANLEDYEPESPRKDDGDTDDDAESLNLTSKKTELTKFPTIDEEQQTALDENCESSPLNVEIHSINTNLNSKSLAKSNVNDKTDIHVDDDVDEICEEIIVMEMESNTTTNMDITTTLSKDAKNDSFSMHHRRAVLKQATFDCDQEEEQDNKSLINLLTESDGEEDNSRDQHILDGSNNEKNVNDYVNDNYNDTNDGEIDSIFNGISDFDDEANTVDNDGTDADAEDNDDDDKLSLIVASYLPDDFEPATTMSPTSTNQQNSDNGKSCSYFRRKSNNATKFNNTNTNKTSSSSTSRSFGKHFQLRRKAHSSNSIGTVTTTANNNSHNDASKDTDKLIGLKLNYKTCCEHRNSIQGKLPKYTGYLSEYGLSQEQLQQREQKLQKKERFVLEQAIKTNEHDMRKMQDNERAFTTWLRNKMRFPSNKTRNMFDVKLKFTGRKKTKSTNKINENGDFNGNNNAGPFGCVAKLRTNF